MDLERGEKLETGCVEVSVAVNPTKTKKRIESMSKTILDKEDTTVVKINFISDWKKLWDYYAQDPTDEISLHTPLLRYCFEFFFHHRTLLIMRLCLVYNVFIACLLAGLFPASSSVSVMIIVPSYYVLLYIMYVAVFLLCKGFTKKITETRAPSNKKNDDDLLPKNPHLSWAHQIGNLFINSVITVREVMLKPTEQSSEDSNKDDRLSFYELMNISLKFLVHHNSVKTSDINFNRPSYKFAMIFTVLVLPFYFYLRNYLPSLIITAASCQLHQEQCNYYVAQTFLSFFYLTYFFSLYVTSGAVVTSLVALAYGGEIAYRLAAAWMDKFSCLRRVELPEMNDEKQSLLPIQSTDTDSFRLGGPSLIDPSQEVESIRVDPRAPDRFGQVLSKVNKVVFPRDTMSLIQRDAQENYLFIREFMNRSGELWSPAMVGLAVFAMFMLFVYIIFTAASTNVSAFALASVVLTVSTRMLILVIYPISSICHANSYLFVLKEAFLVSAPDDFMVIGGRESWLAFLQDVPAIWTLYGLWLTWERLFALMWSILVSVGATAFTFLSGSL